MERPFLKVDQRGSHTFFVKSANENPPRSPREEYAGYESLSPFFNMPKVRYVSSVDKLVVAGVDAKSVEELIKTNPEKAKRGYEDFTLAMLRMWEDTASSMEDEKLVRNMRVESLQMARRLLSEETQITPYLTRELVVNGTKYPPLWETLTSVARRLDTQRDSTMVLRHGDEQAGNVLVNGLYWVIDPHYTGWGSPAQAFNTMKGSNYIFYYNYDFHAQDDTINFRTMGETPELFEPVFKRVEDFIDNMGDNLKDEYLTVNYLRAAAGFTGRPSSEEEKQKLTSQLPVYLGLANEAFYKEAKV